MIVITHSGVRYFSASRQAWIEANDGRDIPQEDYDAMAPSERYAVLSAFAEGGSDPVRYAD